MNKTYITTEDLASRINYNPRYIRDFLLDAVLKEGVHYFRPFGRRKILFIWEAIERDMMSAAIANEVAIPLASGGVCHG